MEVDEHKLIEDSDSDHTVDSDVTMKSLTPAPESFNACIPPPLIPRRTPTATRISVPVRMSSPQSGHSSQSDRKSTGQIIRIHSTNTHSEVSGGSKRRSEGLSPEVSQCCQE